MTERFDKDNDLLIIPDIHGRHFWRKALGERQWSHVVFLGDYTDPYPQEGISQEEAYDNFVDIIHYAQGHCDRVTLLLGNHDMHYKSHVFRQLAGGTRFSHMMAHRYEQLFDTHDDLFSLAYEAEADGVGCLLTHAGVVPSWYSRHEQLIGELNAENLNRLMDSVKGMEALSEIGWMRGGFFETGGPLWADLHEMKSADDVPFQVFGHSQVMGGRPIVTGDYACVDLRKAFHLSELLAMRP